MTWFCLRTNENLLYSRFPSNVLPVGLRQIFFESVGVIKFFLFNEICRRLVARCETPAVWYTCGLYRLVCCRFLFSNKLDLSRTSLPPEQPLGYSSVTCLMSGDSTRLVTLRLFAMRVAVNFFTLLSVSVFMLSVLPWMLPSLLPAGRCCDSKVPVEAFVSLNRLFECMNCFILFWPMCVWLFLNICGFRLWTVLLLPESIRVCVLDLLLAFCCSEEVDSVLALLCLLLKPTDVKYLFSFGQIIK